MKNIIERYTDKFREIMKTYRDSKKSSVTIYVVLRVLVVACMILQLLRGNILYVFLCLASLGLLTLPILLQHRLKIELPTLLEGIIFLFIFAGGVLGEIFDFYTNIPYWDTILHIINGFLCAGIGLALVDLLNESSNKIQLTPLFVVVVAFCFSMTVGVCWEFLEFGYDKFFHGDMQKSAIITTISTDKLDLGQKGK